MPSSCSVGSETRPAVTWWANSRKVDVTPPGAGYTLYYDTHGVYGHDQRWLDGRWALGCLRRDRRRPPREHLRLLHGSLGSQRSVFRVCAALAVAALVGCGTDSESEVSAARIDRQGEVDRSEQFFERLGECLTEKGFPASVQSDGALMVNHGGQVGAARTAEEACTEQLGGWPTSAPPNEEELEKFYDLQVEAYECLVRHGHDPLPPSSKAAFVATYLSGESWFAHMPAVPGSPTLPTTECPLPSLADIDW